MDLSVKKRKILEVQKENIFFFIRSPAAILPADPQISCKAEHVLQYRWEKKGGKI
jgi:hypothetical protein